jgi:hypothetical protein
MKQPFEIPTTRARTMCFKLHVFIMVLMCNPQNDNFDWIKMKGQLRLVLRIEHCSILTPSMRGVVQIKETLKR